MNAIRLPGGLQLKGLAGLHLPAEPSGEAALPWPIQAWKLLECRQ